GARRHATNGRPRTRHGRSSTACRSRSPHGAVGAARERRPRTRSRLVSRGARRASRVPRPHYRPARMPWPVPASLLLAILVAAQVAKLVPRPRFAVLGAAIALAALVLYAVTPAGVIDLSIGVALGVGVGLVVPSRRVT